MAVREPAQHDADLETSSCSPQFLPQHSPESRLEWLALLLNVVAKDLVYRRLVVTAARPFGLRAKPVQHFVVEANRDAGFPLRRFDHRSTLRCREIVFLLHEPSTYVRRSLG